MKCFKSRSFWRIQSFQKWDECVSVPLFRQILTQANKRELAERVQVVQAGEEGLMLTADGLSFRALDLEWQSGSGVSGRDEFFSLLKQSVAAKSLLAKGVVKIQIEDQPPVRGQYQICRLKLIG